jgi:hypothetical protein
MTSHKSDPRRARTGAKVSGQPNRGNITRPARFVPAYPLTAEQVEQALATGDAYQLASALDPYHFDRNIRPDGARFYCPVCNNHGAYAIDRHRWRCVWCPNGGRTGTWLALRQAVAQDAEACIRLARIVHGERILGGAA